MFSVSIASFVFSFPFGVFLDLFMTDSRLKERLNRILSSEYFTMTPELQTVSQQTAAAAASAAGQYHPNKDVDHSVPPPAYYVPQVHKPL